jgi:hypothetical protein
LDLYTDSREESGKTLPTFPAKGMFQCQDGSLTLYAGAKLPGADKESNWLPASGSPFSLDLRAHRAVASGRRRCEQ